MIGQEKLLRKLKRFVLKNFKESRFEGKGMCETQELIALIFSILLYRGAVIRYRALRICRKTGGYKVQLSFSTFISGTI